MTNQLPTNALEAIKIITNCKFKPFDEFDHEVFSGIQTSEPMICYFRQSETDEDGIAVVQDSETFAFFNMQGEQIEFVLTVVNQEVSNNR